MMLANSKNQGLIDHSVAIARMAVIAAKLLGVSNIEVIKRVYQSGLVHDIGKVVSYVQDLFNRNQSTKGEIEHEQYPQHDYSLPLHHEISWAVLSTFLADANHIHVKHIAYWHHARPVDTSGKYYEKANEILSFKEVRDSVPEILEFYKELQVISEYPLPTELDGRPKTTVPLPYYKDDKMGIDISSQDLNEELYLMKACVILADRFVSSITPDQASEIANDKNIGKYTKWMIKNHAITYTLNCPKQYDEKRFDAQLLVALEATKSQTAIIKAPAGYGKTLQGLLWGREVGGQIVWCCPRNNVAESVYKKVVEELVELGSTASVELFLSGEIKQSHNINGKFQFEADIIITNIDNTLLPNIKNSTAKFMYIMLHANMVFDEFHEFASNTPMFAAFINLMKTRALFATKSKTLLLSATPSIMHILWDDSRHTTKLLPNEFEHYKAQHDKPYKVTVLDSAPEVIDNGTVFMSNSVRSSQDRYIQYNATYLTHSKFKKKSRKMNMDIVLEKCGKMCKGIAKEFTVCCALELQASHDISFEYAKLIILSPESDIQKWGRVNRWGEYVMAFVDLIKPHTRSDQSVVNMLYDYDLHTMWYKFVLSEIGDSIITLDELYKLYNKFYKINYNEIASYYMNLYKSSEKHLESYYPQKRRYIEEKNDKESTGELTNRVVSISLRNSSVGRFYTMKEKSGGWVIPDDVQELDFRTYETYRDENITRINNYGINRVLKELIDAGYTEYSKILKIFKKSKGVIPSFDRMSRNSATPLPWLLSENDDILGFIDRN